MRKIKELKIQKVYSLIVVLFLVALLFQGWPDQDVYAAAPVHSQATLDSGGNNYARISKLAGAAAALYGLIQTAVKLSAANTDGTVPTGNVEDRFWERDSDYPAMETWFNGSNSSIHCDGDYWLEQRAFKPQVRGRFILKNGRLNMLNDTGVGCWCMAAANYQSVNEDIYKVLKAFWRYAAANGDVISISGGRGISYDTISIVLSEKDGWNFPRTCSYRFQDGLPPLIETPDHQQAEQMRPWMIFDMGMNYRLSQFEALTSKTSWRDEFLKRGRILEQSLVSLNRNLLAELYGLGNGLEIADFAIQNYSSLYIKDSASDYLRLQNLPNAIKKIGNLLVYFNDDETSRTTLYIDGSKEKDSADKSISTSLYQALGALS